MKIAVYTSITNGYENLKPIPKNQSQDIDFICFTDNPMMYSNGWMLKPIPDDLIKVPFHKQQRLIKILPHRYLPDYDISLWVDGNIQITCDVLKFIQEYDLNLYSFYTRHHPSRDCIFQEARAVINMKKDTPSIVNPQMIQYKKEGFPEHFGMVESCIILRKHNKPTCVLLDNLWAEQILKYSHRDQLSFNYCLWKLKYEIGYLKIRDFKYCKQFQLKCHGR